MRSNPQLKVCNFLSTYSNSANLASLNTGWKKDTLFLYFISSNKNYFKNIISFSNISLLSIFRALVLNVTINDPIIFARNLQLTYEKPEHTSSLASSSCFSTFATICFFSSETELWKYQYNCALTMKEKYTIAKDCMYQLKQTWDLSCVTSSHMMICTLVI